MFLTILQLSIRNLLLHKLRSFLTMLGTILGVGSVISMLAIGEGSKKEALARIRKLGANNIIIRSVKPKLDAARSDSSTDTTTDANAQQDTATVLEYGLTYYDLERLTATIPTLHFAVPIALVRKTARFGRRRILNARILGTTPEFLNVKNLHIKRKRFVTNQDVKKTANVAFLGAGAAKRLFSYRDPINKTIMLGSQVYKVMGVLDTQASGSATPGDIGAQDFNNDIYIPITAVKRRFGELQMVGGSRGRNYERLQLHEITLNVWDENRVGQTASMARKLLKEAHGNKEDFEIQVPRELLMQAEEEKRIWNIVLGAIAGISLLVGGIGIMNIMLATVTERTREIGVRRALGAKRFDITIQFLFETVVLSTTGGIIGTIAGSCIPLIITYSSGIETVLSLWAILLAFGISVGTGIIFGLYPARRAALMNPIEALHHE